MPPTMRRQVDKDFNGRNITGDNSGPSLDPISDEVEIKLTNHPLWVIEREISSFEKVEPSDLSTRKESSNISSRSL